MKVLLNLKYKYVGFLPLIFFFLSFLLSIDNKYSDLASSHTATVTYHHRVMIRDIIKPGTVSLYILYFFP